MTDTFSVLIRNTPFSKQLFSGRVFKLQVNLNSKFHCIHSHFHSKVIYCILI